MLRIKPVVLAVSGALIALAPIAHAGNNAVIDLQPGQTEVALPASGVIDATDPQFRSGITGVGSSQNRINTTLTGSSLLIKTSEFDPDNSKGWGTYGIQAQRGTTINIGTASQPLSKLEIQNHGKTTRAMGMMAWRGNSDKTDAHINVNCDIVKINVSTETDFALGLHAFNDTVPDTTPIPEEDRSSIVIHAKEIDITASSGRPEFGTSTGLAIWSQAKAILEADVIKVKADRVINTRGDSIVGINASGNKDSVVQLDGNIVFEYSHDSGTPVDSHVTVNLLNPQSYWHGSLECGFEGLPADQANELLTVKNMHLGLANGAQWTPEVVNTGETGSNGKLDGVRPLALNNLSLNGGVINVKNADVDVVVEKLTGTGGTINLATDLAAKPAEQAGTVTVQNTTKESALTVNLTNKDMSKVLTADDVTPEQAKPLLGKVDAKDATTTLVVNEGMFESGFDVNQAGNTISHGPNTLMQSTLELASATPLAINRILTMDVRKRMGDIRSSQNKSGAWARYDGGRLSGMNGLENDFNTIQVGVDTQPTADPLRFGVALSYTKGDTDYARGSADMDAYSLAGYGLWLGDRGQYVDVVTRLASVKTDMTVDGNKKGSMDNIALSLSGEFGWRFDVTKNVYVEPQLEATYAYVDADDLTLSDGSTYRFDEADSLIGRAGVAFGLQCPNNKGNVYAKLSAVHEFLGEATVTGGKGATYAIDGKDTWFEYGLGANFNLNDSTYFWADLERTSGGTLDMDYRASLGVRVMF